MVRFNPVPYDGYALVFGGYDTLALMTLTPERDDIGTRIEDWRREGVRSI